VDFVIIPRPGQTAGSAMPPFRVRELRGFPLGVSSSQIRERVKSALSIQGLVPDAVAEAIHNSGLYL
jgi:nicotinic acid mononucleotide adenylyltransferase